MKALETLLKTALMGTARSSESSLELSASLKPLAEADTEIEDKLLKAASLLFVQKEGGKVFSKKWFPTTQAPTETYVYCSQSASRLLKEILNKQYYELLGKWLIKCEEAQLLVQPEHLLQLLALGRNLLDFRPLIKPVVGERGKWLATFNKDWQYLLSSETDIWELGKSEERKSFLASLRKKHPQHALEVLTSSWKSEAADARLAFLEILKQGLSIQDAPFLESALADKSKKVRATTFNLLIRLKDSALTTQLFEAAAPMLLKKNEKSFIGLKKTAISFQKVAVGTQLDVYGISKESLDKKFSDEAYYLYQLIELIHPSLWTSYFGMDAGEVVQVFLKEKELKPMLTALLEATIFHGDEEWAGALSDTLKSGKLKPTNADPDFRIKLFGILSPEDKLRYFQSEAFHMSLLDSLELCNFKWTATFSKKALSLLYKQVAERGLHPYERERVSELYKYINPSILAEKESYLPPENENKATWREAMDQLFTKLEMNTGIEEVF